METIETTIVNRNQAAVLNELI